MKKRLLHNTLFTLAAVGITAIPAMIPGRALAHQVQTNYILNGQSEATATSPLLAAPQADAGASLELRSTFGNGQPLKGASVTVYSPEQPNRVWQKGLTDSEGRYTFKPDESITGEWEVNIKRDGHQDIISVPVTETGIDSELIAQGKGQNGEIQDIHYASSPLMALGSLAIAAASIGFARYSRKKSA
ncbi:MAG: hypothetical protein AAFP03_00750 [Cyanobacteria bacterium J06598_3]